MNTTVSEKVFPGFDKLETIIINSTVNINLNTWYPMVRADL